MAHARWGRLGLAMAGGALATLLVATQAMAGPTNPKCYVAVSAGSTAMYLGSTSGKTQNYLLKVCDTKADGYHAEGSIFNYDTLAFIYGPVKATGGNGSCTSHDGIKIPPNTRIFVQINIDNGSVIEQSRNSYLDGDVYTTCNVGAC